MISKELENKLSKCVIDDIPEFSLDGIKTKCKVVDIYDGDTCKIVIVINNELMRFACRLNFINAPEMKPLKSKLDREKEILHAKSARNRLIQLATNCECDVNNQLSKSDIEKLLHGNSKIVNVQCYGFDLYGRLLVELYNDDTDVKTYNNTLVSEGFANPYDGGKKMEFTY